MAPIRDIDYIIMTNANEESILWHLVSEYRTEFPDLSMPEALTVINEDGSWDVTKADTGVRHCLYARDNSYFGQYHESMRTQDQQ